MNCVRHPNVGQQEYIHTLAYFGEFPIITTSAVIWSLYQALLQKVLFYLFFNLASLGCYPILNTTPFGRNHIFTIPSELLA